MSGYLFYGTVVGGGDTVKAPEASHDSDGIAEAQRAILYW